MACLVNKLFLIWFSNIYISFFFQNSDFNSLNKNIAIKIIAILNYEYIIVVCLFSYFFIYLFKKHEISPYEYK